MRELIIGLLCLALLACSSPTKLKSLGSNVVFVLGSIHGYMLKQPDYTLSKFVGAVDQFKPDLILTEVRPDHSGPIEGSIDGGIEQSLVYAYATEKHVQVLPVDWFDDALISKMAAENKAATPETRKKLKPLETTYLQMIRTASFSELQGQSTQDYVRAMYHAAEEAGQISSLLRNQAICRNLENALQTIAGKRVLIVFGLDHKFFLQDCLSRRGNCVLSLEDFIDADALARFQITQKLKDDSLKSVAKAKAMLQSRLARNAYSTPMKERLAAKLSDFDIWMDVISHL